MLLWESWLACVPPSKKLRLSWHTPNLKGRKTKVFEGGLLGRELSSPKSSRQLIELSVSEKSPLRSSFSTVSGEQTAQSRANAWLQHPITTSDSR